jgi:hypothetical protein
MDMNTISATIDGTAHDFRLLEADIAALTFDNVHEPVVASLTNLDLFVALADAIGVNWNDRGRPDAFFARGVFSELVDPRGEGDEGLTRPSGKALLARAAALLADAGRPWPEVVRATLTMALAGGGLDLSTAAGVADNIARSSKSSSGKFNYVQSVLTPGILSAAAAA